MRESHAFKLGGELFELNWRFWGLISIVLLSTVALIVYPVPVFKGYVDPFYSPTVLILPLVGIFRLTCYAYRKDYYRHAFNHPMNCLDGCGKAGDQRYYSGETGFFSLNNFHRYFFYIGLPLLPFFFYDFYYSMFYLPGFFVFRLGSIIIVANAVLLTMWTISCHALRHLVGGYADCYNCTKFGRIKKKVFDAQSALNVFHEEFAFISLLFVVAVDLYIRALMGGWPVDYTFFKLAI